MVSDKTLFAMDLTALMAVEKIAKDSQRRKRMFLWNLWSRIQQKCFMMTRISFGGMAPMPPPKSLNGKNPKNLPPPQKKHPGVQISVMNRFVQKRIWGKNEILMFGNMIRILFILIGMTRQLWRYLPGPK